VAISLHFWYPEAPSSVYSLYSRYTFVLYTRPWCSSLFLLFLFYVFLCLCGTLQPFHHHHHHHLLLSGTGARTSATSAWLPLIVVDLYAVVDADVDSSRLYADTIDTSREGLAWLEERGLMWEAAVEDANEKGVPVEEYMANIKANTRKFALSDTIFDRNKLLGALRNAFNDEGQFVLLLGGKSVGKSYVLETLKNQYNKASANAFAESETKSLVLYIDARRKANDLRAGLVSEIANLSLRGW
jgi:hypothetical protein